MAIVSSHALNSVDGSHAGGIAVRLINLETGKTVFDTKTDEGGRLAQEVARPDPAASYEMIFQAGAYWRGRSPATGEPGIMDEIVVRFAMPDAGGRYHIPLILSPHGYSLWCSGKNG